MTRWVLDPVESRLVSDDTVVPLTPKAAAVLELLIRRQGEIVARGDILDHVWKGIAVTPDLVREYIFDLRQALGDDAARPRFIETVRGKGVRLCGDIALSGGDSRPTRLPRVTVETPEIFGGADRWREMARPLQQEIRLELARYSDLSVIGRKDLATSAPSDYAFRIATSILIGEDGLTVSVQLIDGQDGTISSTDRFALPLGDFATVTTEVASRVASAVGRYRGAVQYAVLKATERKSTDSHTAYEEYLLAARCKDDMTLETWRTCLTHAERAIALDPGFARAWHMKALILKGLVNFFFDPEVDRATAFSDSFAATRKSASLDTRDPHILAWSSEVHVAEKNDAMLHDTLYRAADLGRRQPDTLAHCAMAFVLQLGRFEEARELIAEALRLAPEPPDWFRMVDCRVSYFVADHARSLAAGQLVPQSLPSLLFGAMSLAAEDRLDKAHAMYADLLSAYPHFDPDAYAANMMPHPKTAEAFLTGVAPLRIPPETTTGLATALSP